MRNRKLSFECIFVAMISLGQETWAAASINPDALSRVKSYSYPNGNAVANGSFENNFSETVYDGWYEGLYPDATVLSQLGPDDKITPFEGHKYIGVKYTCPPLNSGKIPFRLLSDLFPLSQGKNYTLFFWYRAKNLVLPGGAVIKPSVHFRSDKGFSFNNDLNAFEFESISEEVSSEVFPRAFGDAYAAQSDWMAASMQFTAPPGTNYGNIYLLWGSEPGAEGVFYFDRVYLTEGLISSSDIQNMGHFANIGLATKYFNNSNKLIQHVVQDGNRDIVTQNTYDNLGRVKRNLLPIGADFGTGRHRFVQGITGENDADDILKNFYNPSLPVYADDPILGQSAAKYPDAGGAAYTEIRYEDSPTGRVVETANSGSSWKLGSGHTMKFKYSSLPELSNPFELPDVGPNSLNGNFTVKETTGPEEDQVTREFTDRTGRLVRVSSKLRTDVVIDQVPAVMTTWLNTDFQFDANSNPIVSQAPTTPNGTRLTRTKSFNALNQVVSEHTAETGTTEFRYDALGRMRFSRTAEQAHIGTFSFTKYDGNGRVINTGEILDPSFFTTEMAEVSDFPCSMGCSSSGAVVDPLDVKLRTVNHYDNLKANETCQWGDGSQSGGTNSDFHDIAFLVKNPAGAVVFASYDFMQAYLGGIQVMSGQSGLAHIYAITGSTDPYFVSPPFGSDIELRVANIDFDFEGIKTANPQGQALLQEFNVHYQANITSLLGPGEFLEGRLVKSLSCNYEISSSLGEPGPREVSKTFRYDKFGNVTRLFELNKYVQNANYQSQMTTFTYDIQNRLVKKEICGELTCNPALRHEESYGFDQIGRIGKVRGKNGVILHNHYDYLGKLTAQVLGGEMQNASGSSLVRQFDFDLHGNIVMNRTGRYALPPTQLFQERLAYEGGTTPRFDGIITQANYTYMTGTTLFPSLQYDYTYDDLQRLTDAVTTPASSGTTGYEYLDDGRLAYMDRDGKSGIYEYEGGRLKSVAGDLVDGRDMSLPTPASLVFEYDRNGNLKIDKSKTEDGIPLAMSYRSDNMPYLFSYKVPSSLSNQFDVAKDYMVYDGGGNRISKISLKNGSRMGSKSYFSSRSEVRESTDLPLKNYFGLGDFGRVHYDQAHPDGMVDLFITDHLGSTRMVYDLSTAAVKYASHYYPYGKQFGEFNTQMDVVSEKFTGKELDEGTTLSYFGARYYDADIGLWTSPDMARSGAALYGFGNNNPISFFDPDGNEPVKNQLGSAASVGKFLANAKLEEDWYDPNKNPYKGTTKGRYIPANVRGGFIDMNHFLAAAALSKKIGFGVIGAVGSYLGGVGLELSQQYDKVTGNNPGRGKSAFSYEDVPSNDWGAAFSLVYEEEKPLGPQLESFLNDYASAKTPAQFKKDSPETYMALPAKEEK